ncbi:DUF6318 family protein [uncultured Cellulomonas sp.]|uniref:DUF6318 family protein n=1 Tax=uncultured Cellulomonas sp. TaxID=189682 RepID=UPI0028E39202|nr:DUF6318 family protein [uncultured Cellulomonas sp.]
MPWLTSSRDRVRLVAPVTALILLAGCTGGPPTAPESSTPPPIESTPSPTPTPTPTVPPSVDVTVKPERPAALDEPPSVDGAVAVAEYFALLYPYVYATGELAEWRALSDPDCNFCASVDSNVVAMFANGRRSAGGSISVVEATGEEINPGASYTAQLATVQQPSSTVNADGTVFESFPDTTRTRWSMVVHWRNEAWTIRGVDATDEPAS